jgi:archaeal flagellar protein FlaJ
LTSFKARRAASYTLLLLFGIVSALGYLTIPAANSFQGRLEGAFLLSAGLGAVMALAYSFISGSSFVARASKNVVTYDLRAPVSVVSVSAALALFYVYRITGSEWFFIPVPALAAFTLLALRGIYPLRGAAKAPSLEPLREDGLVKFVTGRERLKRLAEFRAQRFSSLLAKSGTVGNPYILAAKSVSQTVLAAAFTLPVALALGIFVWRPLALAALLPALFYVYPEMRLNDGASERREGVEREAPFFSILVNVLGSAGLPLYTIFTEVGGTKIFSFIQREAMLVKRDVEIFGMNPVESFERLASYHPSRKFGSFLFGYTSKVRSGGDVSGYFAGESGSLLRELEESWGRYSGRAGIVGSMMITVFGVLPMLLLILGIFSPATAVLDLTVFTGLGIPMFTILLVFMAGRMQPVGEEPLVGNVVWAATLSLSGLAVGLLTHQAWLGLASVLFIFFTLYGHSVTEQRREMKEIDEALPGFMSDLMEFKRQEYDINKSILQVAANNRYNPSFDRVLSRVAAQLRTGTPLNEVTVDPKSRLARVVFFTLGQMAYSGGGTVETFYQLSVYTERVVEMKRNTMAEMRPYLYMSLASPVMLAFGVAFISGVIGSFGSLVGPGLTSLRDSHFAIGVVTPQLKEVSNLLIVVSSAALGIISAKILDFTVRNTLRASVNVVVATVAAYALTQIDIPSLLHLAL